EADAYDDLRATPRHVAERLLPLGLGRHLELAVLDARVLLEALGSVVRRLVEGLVELASHVEDDGRHELLRGDDACQDEAGDEQDGGSEQPPRISHRVRLLCAVIIAWNTQRR